MDLVSVIVPIYNTEEYLENCIESLINQEYKNIEILLVNDGSPDNSKIIMEKYKKKDNRIKCFYKKNGGLSDARNYGLKKAKGKYICFVDSDDWVNSNYVSKLLNTIKKDKSDIAVCEFDRVYDKKKTKNKININDINGFKVPAAWNKIYKKEKIDKYKLEFPKGRWYEDLTMTSKYIMTCNKRSIINETLCNYRQNNNSIMHTYDDRIFQIFDALEDITLFAKENKLYNKNKEGIEFSYVYHVLVGTIFRASFHKDFSKEMIKNILSKVEENYPKWYNNYLVKCNLSVVYKTYLFLLKKRMFSLIYYLLKIFNKYLYL